MGEIIEIKCQACNRAREYFIGGSGIGGDLTPLFRCLACNFMETKEKEHSSITVTFECPKCSASMEEIDEGAKLNDHEREALACAIAEEDTEGWLGHHGFQIDLDDGSVFTYFVGHSMGQGGASFNFIGIYSSKEDLIEVIQEEPSFALS